MRHGHVAASGKGPRLQDVSWIPCSIGSRPSGRRNCLHSTRLPLVDQLPPDEGVDDVPVAGGDAGGAGAVVRRPLECRATRFRVARPIPSSRIIVRICARNSANLKRGYSIGGMTKYWITPSGVRPQGSPPCPSTVASVRNGSGRANRNSDAVATYTENITHGIT